MKICISILALLAVMFAGQANAIAAGFQTLAVPEGTLVKLSSNGTGSAEVFCMDPHLQAPESGHNYSKLVGGDAVVTIGDRQMSLQAAMDAGLISVLGHHLTYVEFLKAVGAGPVVLDADQAAGLREIYELVAAQPDCSALDFISHSTSPLTIEFRRTGLLSAGSESGAKFANADYLNLVCRSSNEEDHDKIQEELWQARRDAQMSALGYRVDGEDGGAELNRFRKDFGVDATDIADQDELTADAVNRSLLMQEIRPRDPGLARIAGIRIEHPRLGHETLYSVFDDSGRLVLATDEPTKVADKLREVGADAPELFVDIEGFTADEKVALEASLRERGVNKAKLVMREDGDYPNAFFTRGATKLVDAVPVIYKTRDVTLPYGMDVHLLAQGKDVNLTFLGRTRQVLKNTFAHIKAKFVSKDVSEMSVCELVAICRKDLRELHKVNDADLQVLLDGTLARTQTVRVTVIEQRRAA